MLRILHNTDVRKVYREGLTFLCVERWFNGLEDLIEQCDGLVLESCSKSHQKEIISNVRRHSEPRIYLKPIFYNFKLDDRLENHTDGSFTDEKSTISNANKILQMIQRLPYVSVSDADENLKIRILQFMYTRDAELIPWKDRQSPSGYAYPFLSLFPELNGGEIIDFLLDMSQRGYVRFNLMNQIQLCTSCKDSFLIFKETCPRCNSIDLSSEDFIHHFSCAHIAPKSAFKSRHGDLMECPKCNRQLRHIGIDYDKPSVMFTCKNCNHNFQDAEILAECHSCNTANSLEQLITIPINKYSLARMGSEIAENPMLRSSVTAYDHASYYSLRINAKSSTDIKGKFNFETKIDLTPLYVAPHTGVEINALKVDLLEFTRAYVDSENHQTCDGAEIKLLHFGFTKEEMESMYLRLNQNLNVLLADNLDISEGIPVMLKRLQ